MKKCLILALIFNSMSAFSLELQANFLKKLKGNFRNKIELALEQLNSVLETPEFYQRVKEIQTYTCMDSHSNGVTRADQVSVYIKQAKVEFYLRSYRGFSAVAGTSGNIISLNKRYRKNSVNAWANTLMHEILHVAGFGHCGLNDISRYPYIKEAVPYKVGKIVEDMLDESFNSENL